jgi:hypothetical protein
MTKPCWPFPQEAELNAEFTLNRSGDDNLISPTTFILSPECMHLPGESFCSINSQELSSRLSSELLTTDLDNIAPYLWLVATQQSSHVSPLHQQIVKGRTITITEDPSLHCTWIYDRVFLKPIPAFLLSWGFWQYYLNSSNSCLPQSRRVTLRQAALGFLRTYYHLVKHPSDFRIAKEHYLVPGDVTYAKYRVMFAYFAEISDAEVSPRYRYGELRLSRLNFWAKIFLRRFAFQKVHVHYGYGTYLARFYGPILFVFGFVTVMLSAMQNLLASFSFGTEPNRSWRTFGFICRYFSVATIVVSVLLLVLISVLLLFMLLRELTFAVKMLSKNSREKKQQEKRSEYYESSGMMK